MKTTIRALAAAHWPLSLFRPEFNSAGSSANAKTAPQTHPVRRRGAALLAAAALALGGCGKSPDASESNAPLEGRPVGRASQLVGTWMYASAGEFAGLEFLKDGKVIAT